MNGYIKPRSWSFWAGAVLILDGLMLAADDVFGPWGLGAFARSLTGDVGPSALIAQGVAIIGLRRAIGDGA